MKKIINWIRELFNAKKQVEILKQHKEKLQFENKILTHKEISPHDKKYWDQKWKQNPIYYAAPNKKEVREYLKYKEIKSLNEVVDKISKEIKNPNQIPKEVMGYLKELKLEYVADTGETWSDPETFLQNQYGDCDDHGILEYYLIREIFLKQGIWNEVKHRLKCVCGNVNRISSIPSVVGGHFYLLWLGDDCEWYTIETTYDIDDAINSFGIISHKLKTRYGVIWFTFNDEFAWAQNSIVISKEDFYKEEIQNGI